MNKVDYTKLYFKIKLHYRTYECLNEETFDELVKESVIKDE